MGLLLRAWVEKTIHWVERYFDFQVKNNFLEQRPVKKISLQVFYDIKGLITYDFLKKKYNCKQCFLLPTPEAKFTLFIE